jgi:excisionase family DNA binding protein
MRSQVSGTELGGMLTTRQVASFLQVSICTVRRWGDHGLLKYYKIGNRGDRRYLLKDVQSFVGLPPRTHNN